MCEGSSQERDRIEEELKKKEEREERLSINKKNKIYKNT